MRVRNTMDETQLREKFCLALRQLWTRGMIVGADGFLSCEVHRRRYLATPAGRRRVDLEPADLICVDIGGDNVNSGEGVPMDIWQPHRDAYQTHLDPAAGTLSATAMIEPANVLALLSKQDGQAELNLGAGGKVPIVNTAVDASLKHVLADKTEVLFRGHGPGRGLFIAAVDLPTLLNRIERIDLSAAVMLAAGR